MWGEGTPSMWQLHTAAPSSTTTGPFTRRCAPLGSFSGDTPLWAGAQLAQLTPSSELAAGGDRASPAILLLQWSTVGVVGPLVTCRQLHTKLSPRPSGHLSGWLFPLHYSPSETVPLWLGLREELPLIATLQRPIFGRIVSGQKVYATPCMSYSSEILLLLHHMYSLKGK